MKNAAIYRRSSPNDSNIVSYNPLILWMWHSNIALNAVKSDIFHIYVSKSGEHKDINVMYQGEKVDPNNQFAYWRGARCISSSEACFELLGFQNYSMTPAVKVLPVHLDGQRTTMTLDDNPEKQKKFFETTLSPLERYFRRPLDKSFDNITYAEYYEKYSFNSSESEKSSENFWDEGNSKSENKKNVFKSKVDKIVRIESVLPSSNEAFYLRILLLSVPARSFDELYYVPLDDKTKEKVGSYRQAAIRRCLIENGNEGIFCLSEAIKIQIDPVNLRWLSYLLLTNGSISYNDLLEYLLYLMKEYIEYNHKNVEDQIDLKDISDHFNLEIRKLYQKNGGDIRKLNLPDLPDSLKPVRSSYLERYETDIKSYYNVNNDINVDNLNQEQRSVHDKIVSLLADTKSKGKLQYLNGRAGTGKTYTIWTILKSLFQKSVLTIPCGSTGIAASQYYRGQTVHKCFQLVIGPDSNKTITRIGKESEYGDLIKNVQCFIIDEVSMLTEDIITRIDLALKSLYDYKERDSLPLFAGKNILLVGDFLQLPPVIRDHSITDIYSKTLLSSKYFQNIINYALFTPVRYTDPDWQLFVRNLTNNTLEEGTRWSQIPGIKVTDDVNEAIDFYLTGTDPKLPFPNNFLWIASLNNTVFDINKIIQDKRNQKGSDFKIAKAFYKCDTMSDDPDKRCRFDLLMELYSESGSPSDKIRLQVNDPVYIMRNLSLENGIVKGTRGTVEYISDPGNLVKIKLDNG